MEIHEQFIQKTNLNVHWMAPVFFYFFIIKINVAVGLTWHTELSKKSKEFFSRVTSVGPNAMKNEMVQPETLTRFSHGLYYFILSKRKKGSLKNNQPWIVLLKKALQASQEATP